MTTANEILEQIFDLSIGYEREPDDYVLRLCPTFEQVRELATLLSYDPGEEDLQQFLECYPQFLAAVCGGYGDLPLAFISKPRINEYFADFAVLSAGQGYGCTIHLVEIKKSSEKLYLSQPSKCGEPSGRHREGRLQIENRDIWLNEGTNSNTFVSNFIKLVKTLPQYPSRSHNQSFQLGTAQSTDQIWRGFGGDNQVRINHLLIIGRWSQLTEQERIRLLQHNRRDNSLYQILTYDQLARIAFNKPYFSPL